MYCAVLAILYLLVIALGIFLLAFMPSSREYSQQEITLAGIAYIVVGAILFLVFAVAFFLPPKPYNWIVGIVMMAIGMTSCCFIPFVVPLFIFWLKPETKAFFGRND